MELKHTQPTMTAPVQLLVLRGLPNLHRLQFGPIVGNVRIAAMPQLQPLGLHAPQPAAVAQNPILERQVQVEDDVAVSLKQKFSLLLATLVLTSLGLYWFIKA